MGPEKYIADNLLLLEAGGLIFLDEAYTVRTLLGSCVAVTFYHKESGTGAMMHGMYAGYGDSAFYIGTAIDSAVRKFKSIGVSTDKLEVKVFGGATLSGLVVFNIDGKSVGQLNVRSAFESLQHHNLKVLAKDVGCACPRDLYFNILDGSILLKRLHNKKTCTSPFCENQKFCPAHI